MSEENKIFCDDSNLPLKSTTKRPMDSKRDIDAELARWGITKTMWDWDLSRSTGVEVAFQLPRDKFYNSDIPLSVRLTPPIVWKRTRKGKSAEIDWRLSIRLLYWYIHYQMAWIYANQSSPVVAFLPHIAVSGNETVKDRVIPQMENLKALPLNERKKTTLLLEGERENDRR